MAMASLWVTPSKYLHIEVHQESSHFELHGTTSEVQQAPQKKNPLEVIFSAVTEIDPRSLEVAYLLKRSPSWWFQPLWKILISQNGNLPQIGVKMKNIWNHHLVT